MNKLTKILISIFTFIFIINYAHAVSYPKRFYKSDRRIAVVDYDDKNVIAIRGGLGYVTTISLPDDETISSFVIGTDNLWSVESTRNLIIVKPVAVKAKDVLPDNGDNGATTEAYIEPDPEIWKTNLVVVTDQHTYNFELRLATTNVDFKVSVQIPKPKPIPLTPAEIIERDQLKAQVAKDEYEKSLVTPLPYGDSWTYDIQTGKIDASKIKPFYVYDNNKFMYIGFKSQQEIPSVYSLSENKEHLVQLDTLNNKDGTTTLVIFNLYKSLILRSGQRVIQINKY